MQKEAAIGLGAGLAALVLILGFVWLLGCLEYGESELASLKLRP
jgi:hypothetical protein